MKLTTTETFKIAAELLNKHGLLDRGWYIIFDNAKRRLGRCSFRDKEIRISKNYLEILNKEEIIDTILHEIAHALVGPDHGHGNVWKKKAKEIGCNGERIYKGTIKVKTKYFGTCPNCGVQTNRHRRTRIACRVCCTNYNGGNFDPKYLFVWGITK